MKNSNWNNLRTKLHHDWLQNRYLTFLNSWKSCFDNPETCGTDKHEVLDQLLQWKGKRDAFVSLFNNAEEALSPRQLLYEPPLNQMSEENKEWLGEVIHALYCGRTGIKDKVAMLNSMMAGIDKAVDETAQFLKSGESKKHSPRSRIVPLFSDFSRKISELPHEIQVV